MVEIGFPDANAGANDRDRVDFIDRDAQARVASFAGEGALNLRDPELRARMLEIKEMG